jgi:transcriptional regulator
MARRKVGVDALYGTLEVLILKSLVAGPAHGLDVARRIRERSLEVLKVEEGALYPALHRLERLSLVAGVWRISEKGRRARFYDLTAAGRTELAAEIRRWHRHTEAVGRVLGVEGWERS